MSKKYKWTLRPGSRKDLCPQCGKKRFVRYVLTSDEKTEAGQEFGRCDRIENCGYHLYPQHDKNFKPIPIIEKKYETPKFDTIPKKTVESTFNNFKENVFFRYFIKTFGREVAWALQEKYNIGTAKNGGTIFWQQDRAGQFRTGKVIYYNENGKRRKDKMSWFVHKKINEKFLLSQVFFGEHLIFDAEKIALCESEKTAILMSIFEPDFTWIASGGAQMLNDYRLSRLQKIDKVFADNGQFESWELKTKHFENRQMDISVDKAVSEGILQPGDDILDLYILKTQNHENKL